MIGRHTTHRRGWLVSGAAVLLVLAVAGGDAMAAAKCKQVSGKFTLEPVSGPDCTSAVAICAKGTYQGDIVGTSTFTGTSVIPTVDTPTTAVVLLTGDNAIDSAGGTLLTKDAIVLQTTGDGHFAEVDTIVGGTGVWAGRTGVLRAHGTFTPTAGGEGRYVGELCEP